MLKAFFTRCLFLLGGVLGTLLMHLESLEVVYYGPFFHAVILPVWLVYLGDNEIQASS